jgi:chromosome segregation ATPase
VGARRLTLGVMSRKRRNIMGLTESLDVALKAADTEVRDFLDALKSEIRKLQKQNIKLQAQHVSDQERISELENQLKELQAQPTIILQHFKPPNKEQE